MVVRIHPREPKKAGMRKHLPLLFSIPLLWSIACSKSGESEGSSSANEAAQTGLECQHDLKVNTVIKKSWPYPADVRNLLWTGRYNKRELKLKPSQISFVTATLTFREGDYLEVLDSEVHVVKPRRLLAKRDIYVSRKVTRQGIERTERYLVAKAGEPASFLFYNSEGFCMVNTQDGPGWTQCTLDDTFEGLSAEKPHACAQNWWVQVERSKVDKGWMIVNPTLSQRVAGPPDATK